jgi:hypothetical protein
LEFDVINRETLSNRISMAYTDIRHAIAEDKRGALYELSKSAQTQQGLPLEILDDMLSM